jgi:hypothetical protein
MQKSPFVKLSVQKISSFSTDSVIVLGDVGDRVI